MKILLVTEFFPTGRDLRFSGGVEARTYYVAKYLAKNHKVFILASLSPGTKSREKISNIDVLRVGPKRVYTASVGHFASRLKYIKNAVEVGTSINADIVEGGNYISHFIAKSISLRKNIPAVAWYPDVWLGDWLKNAKFYGIFGEILERYNLFRGFDAYIAISKKTQTLLSKYTKKKIHLIYCGVDHQEFSKNEKKSQNHTILCISRLASYKNIKTLVLACAHLSRSYPDTILQIVGEGPEEKNLKSLVGNLKITNKDKERIDDALQRAKNWVEKYNPEMKLKVNDKVPADIIESLMVSQKKAIKELAIYLFTQRKYEDLYTKLYEIAKINGLSGQEFFQGCYKVLLNKDSAILLANLLLS